MYTLASGFAVELWDLEHDDGQLGARTVSQHAQTESNIHHHACCQRARTHSVIWWPDCMQHDFFTFPSGQLCSLLLIHNAILRSYHVRNRYRYRIFLSHPCLPLLHPISALAKLKKYFIRLRPRPNRTKIRQNEMQIERNPVCMKNHQT